MSGENTLIVIQATVEKRGGTLCSLDNSACIVDEESGMTSARYVYEAAKKAIDENPQLKGARVVVLTNDPEAVGMADKREDIVLQEGIQAGPALAIFLEANPQYKYVVRTLGNHTFTDFDSIVAPMVETFQMFEHPTLGNRLCANVCGFGQNVEIFSSETLLAIKNDPEKAKLPAFIQHITGLMRPMTDYHVVEPIVQNNLNEARFYPYISPLPGYIHERSLANVRRLVAWSKESGVNLNFNQLDVAWDNLRLSIPDVKWSGEPPRSFDDLRNNPSLVTLDPELSGPLM